MLEGKSSLVAALALGALAAGLAHLAIAQREQRARKGWDTVKVLCAEQDIPEGAELTREMIAVRDLPERFITASFLRLDKQPEAGAQIVGQRVLVPLKRGDPLLLSTFESARQAEFSSMINPRGRAVTIEVQERTSVGQWVRPNDHVDVVGTFRDPQTQQLKTSTLLQNVVVLATGRVDASTAAVPGDDSRYSTVTLLVLPEEAEILTLAQESGTLTLFLRNPDDLDVQDKRNIVDGRSLLEKDRAGELQQKRYRTIQIIRGRRGSGGSVPAAGE